MDAGRVAMALKATMDPRERAAAEEYLTSVRKIIGFTPVLLKIVLSEDVEPPVRHAAVIYVKNMINSYWEEVPEEETRGENRATVFTIHEQDRFVIREGIIDAIIQSPEVIRTQLAECVRTILRLDFPGRWPHVFSKIVECISVSDGKQWFGALLVLQQLVKNYEYKKVKEKTDLVVHMKNVLPLLYQRMCQLMPNNSQESVYLQKIIIKTFYTLVQFNLHPDLMTPEHFVEWMELARQVVEQPLPEETLCVDPDDRPQLVWWKIKKWAGRLMGRMLERFNYPKNSTPEYKPFAELYSKNCAVPAVRTMLKIVMSNTEDNYVTPRLLYRALTLLQKAVGHANTWQVFKDQIMDVITQGIFPLLCHSKEDEELWENDPQEYVRFKYDILEDLVHPVSGAASFLGACIRHRKLLPKIVSVIEHVLNERSAEPQHIDGALHMFGQVNAFLIKKKAYKTFLETVITSQVVPRASDKVRFLRARACWCIQQYSRFRFAHMSTLSNVTAVVVNCLLHDTEIPVKVEAAMALQMILYDQEKGCVLPYLKPIILREHIGFKKASAFTLRFVEILEMLKETENDELNSVMSCIISTFEEHVGPIAVDIAKQLASIFADLTSGDDVKEDKSVTALGVLGTLESLLDAAEEKEESIFPFLKNKREAMAFLRFLDFYEQAYSLICSLNFLRITPALWDFYSSIYGAFRQCGGVESFSDIMPMLYNYVTVGQNKFLEDPNHFSYRQVFNKQLEEDSESYAAKLLEVVLLQFRGQIDTCIKPIVELVVTRLGKEIFAVEFRVLCLSVIIAALVYNPELAIEVLLSLRVAEGSESLLDHFIKHWVSEVATFNGIHNRKMCLFGLCAIAQLRDRPPVINEVARSIIPSCIVLFEGLQRAYEAKAEEESESTDNEEEDDDLTKSDSDENTSGGVAVAEDGLQHEAANDKLDTDGIENDDDSDYTFSDEIGSEDFEIYETVIDKEGCGFDEYVTFKDMLTTLQQRDPHWYLALVSGLDDAQNKSLEKVFLLAEQKRAALGFGHIFIKAFILANQQMNAQVNPDRLQESCGGFNFGSGSA
ncbi:importin 7 [Trichuris trichiura]|uniref:Importin 7 n=1 Tax=Trichuris trichiura TaxID=36087 RepID=A0A077Z789_TRITR|nr:importin 7 [Trichuris trichiura]